MSERERQWERRREQLTWLCVAVGIGLRLWQYAAGASLYLDEVSVARNIADRTMGQLLAPLDYAQVAPPGWLLVERALWVAFHSDASLRFVSFVSSIVSLLLVRAIARRTLTGWAIPFAVGAFAVGVPFILYGAQVKQYASDVAFTLALQLMALRLLDGGDAPHDASAPEGVRVRRSRAWQAAALGVVAVWCSNAAVLVVAGIGAALLLLAVRGDLIEPRRVVVRVVLPWGLAAIAASLTSRVLVSPETLAFMRTFWADAGSFAPTAPFGWRHLLWPLGRLRTLLEPPSGLGYVGTDVYTVLACAGAWLLWRRRRAYVLILVGPILVALCVAALQLYPFSNRLVLFLTPAVLLAVAASVGAISERVGARVPVAGAAVVAGLSVGPVLHLAQQHPVYRLQEVRPLLDWVQARRQPGDALFVWYRLIPNVQWYADSTRFPVDRTLWGGCHLGNAERFLAELDTLRGHSRVWVLTAGGGSGETRYLLSYADSIGRRLDGVRMDATLPGYLSIEARLYDFSDRDRLARYSVATFPTRPPTAPPQAVLACTSGPMAVRRPQG